MTTDKEKEFAENTKKQVKWWAYAGWTLPFVALAILFSLSFVGWDDVYSKIIIVIGISFFSVSVFWWWWAIFRIYKLSGFIESTLKKFEAIQKKIEEIKKDL